MDLDILSQQGTLIELRHRILGLNITNCETESQVQSKQKARKANILNRV